MRVFRSRWLVCGEHGGGRLRVAEWEKDLAKRIAGKFRRGDKDLEAELLARLIELKARDLVNIQDWQAFLARSLYNAAKNFFRREDRLRATFITVQRKTDEDDQLLSLEATCPAPEESIDLRFDLTKVWETLSPEMRELWGLLVEEGGNASRIARRLSRPRKTVVYWIQKLRAFLKERGIE
jgi:DNA-directed RNA polymerase specialized sigma24 family protein